MTITNLSNSDIVLFSLLKLGGVTKKIHTEILAWDAYQISKERFSWSLPEFRKKGFPDKTTARYALESAKKTGLVKGRAGRDKWGGEKEGWQFTPMGVNWILKNEQRISSALNRNSVSRSITTQEIDRIINRIKSHKTFINFQKHDSLENITKYDFIDFLNCSPDASNRVIKIKFDLLKNSINFTGDLELRKFISMIEKKFSAMLFLENL